MKSFKKRTIALILASVVSITGSLAADNYKNSLMALEFEPGTNGSINISVQTKAAYSGNVTPVQNGSNTFVLMLPEINSFAATPDITKVGNIESVNIRTMPYSSNGKGYTRITIKTTGAVKLFGQNKIFLPPAEKTQSIEQKEERVKNIPVEDNRIQYNERQRRENSVERNTSYSGTKDNISNNKEEVAQTNKDNAEKAQPQNIAENSSVKNTVNDDNTTDSSAVFLMLMSILLIIVCSIYFYIKAKNKLQEIAGEDIKIELEEDNEEDKKSNSKNGKLNKIKKTINKLDSKYPKTATMVRQNRYTTVETNVNNKQEDVKEIENVVDLDELFHNEKKQENSVAEDESNDLLEDFLSSFIEENEETEEADTISYDENLYNEVMNEKKLRFTAEDVKKINDLMNKEIDDTVLKNIGNYLVSNPIIKAPNKQKILENFVTEYSISQNIIFSGEDILALQKLMNVEIDFDFITDLKTNSERTKEVSKEILTHKPKKYNTEILTLNVQDMLPNLSEELRKQGNKKIESEVKSTTVYFSEGYEYTKLKVDSSLSNITEMADKYDNKHKRTEQIQYTDDKVFYDVDKLITKEELPDLKDVLKHPEKYEEKPVEKYVPDENKMLSDINNVTFKPFYDGTTEFEVINKFDDEDNEDKTEEFDFSSELVITKEGEVITVQKDNKDEITDNQPEEVLEPKKVEDKKPEFLDIKLERKIEKARLPKEHKSKEQQELLERVERLRKARQEKLSQQKEAHDKSLEYDTNKKECEIKYVIDNETYTVLSTISFDEKRGCHLAKNSSGYTILSYVNNNIQKIRDFDDLKSTKLQARLSENLSDNTSRYIVRIATTKFIIDVTENSINYVMDL